MKKLFLTLMLSLASFSDRLPAESSVLLRAQCDGTACFSDQPILFYGVGYQNNPYKNIEIQLTLTSPSSAVSVVICELTNWDGSFRCFVNGPWESGIWLAESQAIRKTGNASVNGYATTTFEIVSTP